MNSKVNTENSSSFANLFKKSGFFNERFEFHQVFENFGQGYVDYINSCLDQKLVKERMGTELPSAIKSLIKSHQQRLLDLRSVKCLLHSDFNPKNILVDGDEVAAVIDWDWSCSGHPCADLGNFFRFEDDYPDGFQEAFMVGYRQYGGELEEDWEEIAKLLDLASMCSFLSRPGELTKTTKTALEVCHQTLRFFS